jgi:cell division protein FtsQ
MDTLEQEKARLSGGLDGEDESPYLRRQKALPLRRSRVSRRLRWAVFGIFVLLPVGFAGYGLASFALTSPRFVLNSPDDVMVVGNRFVSREEVLNALGLPLGGPPGSGANIFRISLAAKRTQVESIPWIQSAALTRVFPHRLLVCVVERTPVAFVNIGERVGLVDSDGVLLEKPEKAVFDFPVLSGLDAAGSVDERRARLTLYQDFAQQLGEEASHAGWLVSEVDLADRDDLKALLVQDRETVQVHFGHQDFLARFRNFLALLPEVRKTNTRIDSVDLRYRNQIVVNPQPAAPPANAASPAPAGAMKE